MGMPPEASLTDDYIELFHRSSPARSAELGVGLAVVKVLIEQSGGTLVRNGESGSGTSFVATLPRYDVDDFLA
jgi:signal transduction histidine kinase